MVILLLRVGQMGKHACQNRDHVRRASGRPISLSHQRLLCPACSVFEHWQGEAFGWITVWCSACLSIGGISCQSLIEELLASHSTDLQQRAYELQTIIGLDANALKSIMPADASCEEIEMEMADSRETMLLVLSVKFVSTGSQLSSRSFLRELYHQPTTAVTISDNGTTPPQNGKNL